MCNVVAAEGSGCFSIHFAVNGFMDEDNFYEGGDVEWFDYCHSPNLSLVLFDRWMARLNCKYPCRYLYRLREEYIDTWHPLDDEMHIEEFIRVSGGDTFLHVS